jgi:hypothetical protein
LLKSILQQLLEDFQYWFGRSATLLETEEIAFLTSEEQSELLARVQQAQQKETSATDLKTSKRFPVNNLLIAETDL